MPPRGVKKGSKWGRMYEHVKESELSEGRSEDRAEEIAARTVNKERAGWQDTRVLTAFADRHLLFPSRRPAVGSRPGRPHLRPALRGGEGQGRQGTLEDEQARARSRRRKELTMATTRQRRAAKRNVKKAQVGARKKQTL